MPRGTDEVRAHGVKVRPVAVPSCTLLSTQPIRSRDDPIVPFPVPTILSKISPDGVLLGTSRLRPRLVRKGLSEVTQVTASLVRPTPLRTVLPSRVFRQTGWPRRTTAPLQMVVPRAGIQTLRPHLNRIGYTVRPWATYEEREVPIVAVRFLSRQVVAVL